VLHRCGGLDSVAPAYRIPQQAWPSMSRQSRQAEAGPAGMKKIAGGEFLMGSADHYPEEKPVRRAQVGDFWIDQFPVTNRQFSEFVEATGHVTFAEKAPDPRDYPGMPAEMARAGSAVFVPTTGPVDLSNPGLWWKFVFGADWRHPEGPESAIAHRMDHPVVQIAYEDALAYAQWAGKDLPSEAEWEFAARGGLEQKPFAWGDTLMPGGRPMANYWEGEFPWAKSAGFTRTSPVGAFPPNGYGLYDMIGNVWEWTRDWYSTEVAEARSCCGPPRARLAHQAESFDPYLPQQKIPRKVCKGGSRLCADKYCRRYRPAARHPQPVDSPTSHTGFRCVIRL
jgi:formylglycine-generating enzyme required for sulfatase activity